MVSELRRPQAYRSGDWDGGGGPQDGYSPCAPGGSARGPQARAGKSAPWGPWAPLPGRCRCLCSEGMMATLTGECLLPHPGVLEPGQVELPAPADTAANPTLFPVAHQL